MLSLHQQYKYFLDTISVTGEKRIFFIATFLKSRNRYCWHWYKEEFGIFLWSNFQLYFHCNRRNSGKFVNNIWTKFCWIIQYKLEIIWDQSSQLEYLQLLLQTFHATEIFAKKTMTCYFCKSFWLSITKELDPCNDEQEDKWSKLMKNTLKAETKVW